MGAYWWGWLLPIVNLPLFKQIKSLYLLYCVIYCKALVIVIQIEFMVIVAFNNSNNQTIKQLSGIV